MSWLKNVHLLKKAKSQIWNQIAYTLCSLLNNTTTVRLKNNKLKWCKLLVKKDAILNSLDAKERSCDNSTYGINFTNGKVNLMFVFIVAIWIFVFNKYMIQNPVFFVYNVIMLSIVLRNCLVG